MVIIGPTHSERWGNEKYIYNILTEPEITSEAKISNIAAE
jgi:hypothetical protein